MSVLLTLKALHNGLFSLSSIMFLETEGKTLIPREYP